MVILRLKSNKLSSTIEVLLDRNGHEENYVVINVIVIVINTSGFAIKSTKKSGFFLFFFNLCLGIDRSRKHCFCQQSILNLDSTS